MKKSMVNCCAMLSLHLDYVCDLSVMNYSNVLALIFNLI